MATKLASGWTEDEARLRRRIFWVAFLVRVLVITVGHTYRVRAFGDHFQFGWEMGRIARAVATGFGYADPFEGHTGPTAWSPPLYVLLIAGVFKLCSVYSALSAWVILTLNAAMSAATAVAVWEIGRRCFNRSVAMWSGWMWALHPAAMQFAIHWVWEMTGTACLYAWILVLSLRMKRVGGDATGQTWLRWSVWGLLWGALALTGPTPLIALPVLGAWLLFERGFGAKRVVMAAVAGLVFCAVVAPWAARNWVVFHRFIPFRGNLGAENFMGNAPWANGQPWGTTIPLENKRMLRQYAEMGEANWVQMRGDAAKQWVATHHTRFAELTAKRAYLFWAGVPHPLAEGAFNEYTREIDYQFLSLAGWFGALLAVRRRVPAAWIFLLSFVLLPVTYYLVTVQARFRHVLEPLICVLGVYLFQSAEPGRFGCWVAARFAWLGRLTMRLRPFFRGDVRGAI